MSDYNKADIGSGYNTQTAVNTELGKVETAVNSKVDKSGSTMTGDLDMNSNDILNTNSMDVQSLSINGTNITATGAAVSALPDQSGNSAKVLSTNGSTAAWVQGGAKYFATVAAAQADTQLKVGEIVLVGERANALFDVITATTNNGYDIIDGTGSGVSFQLKSGQYLARAFGAVGDGVTDDTAAVQRAVTASSKVVLDKGYSFYFAGGANSIDVNKSDIEIVVDGEIIQDSTGAAFHIAADGGSYENIKIHGSGLLKNPTTLHASETTGILIGSTGASIDNLEISIQSIKMSKYGVANGSIDTELTNFKLYDSYIEVNVDGWASGSAVAQAFEMNLPSATAPSGIVTGNVFVINNTTTTNGDCFKWTNGSLIYDDNQCILNGQGQTVAVFSSMDNSRVSDSTFRRLSATGTITDVVQMNNSTESEFLGLHVYHTGSVGGAIQLGTNTDCHFQFYTNGTVRQTASTTMTDCSISDFVASDLVFTNSGISWVGGRLSNGKLSGQCYLTCDDVTISDITADIGGAALRGLYLKGDGNRVDGFTVIDSTSSYAVQVEGNDNDIKGLTLDDCNAAWEVVSGSNNRFGRISFPSPTSANYSNYNDSGTNTSYPLLQYGGLTGSTTIAAPSNPEGQTIVELTFLSGVTTITDITGAQDKDRVLIFQAGASNNFTISSGANFATAGGAAFTGNQSDCIELLYNDTLGKWIEISRSVNS